jgi:hypothetical protein
VSSGWLGHLLREFSMRKSVFLAVAISAAALAVASPAMAAGKLALFGNIVLGANGVDQSNNTQDQSGINASSNPFMLGVNAAVLTGANPFRPHGSQSIDQTQSGFIVFPFAGPNHAPGQVALAGNLEIFSWRGNDQSITQDQHALALTGSTVQVALGVNAVAFGSRNTQSIDQSQDYAGINLGGTPQVAVGANVVLGGNRNNQSITQNQTDNAFLTAGTNQTAIGVNAVVDGNRNTQTISQTQTDTSFANVGAQDTAVAVNVVVDGNGNKQGITQIQ